MKSRKATQSVMISSNLQFEFVRERKDLLSRYKSKESILSQLREIPVHVRTYEFLGELFFQVAAKELENDPPTEKWIKELKDVRHDVYLLFELARASRFV